MAGSFERDDEPAGFHKMRGISWLAEKLLASQEELCCMALVYQDGTM